MSTKEEIKARHVYDPLGDGISCVELIDWMGDDTSIVRAARVSYQRDNEQAGLPRDEKLIRYMLSHAHGTPFEHTSVTIHVALPIFVARQWIRHRIGWSFNEVSRRYTSEDIQVWIPDQLREQDKKNKQGSVGSIAFGDQTQYLIDELRSYCEAGVRLYNQMVKENVANELARICLPLNLYTRWYATANVRSIMHWHTLRADPHAQLEVQVYANAVCKIMEDLYPITWKAYENLETVIRFIDAIPEVR